MTMINKEKVFYDHKKLYEWTGFYNFKSPFNNLHGIRYVPEYDNDNNYTNDVGFYPLEFILNQEYGLNVKVNHTNDEFKTISCKFAYFKITLAISVLLQTACCWTISIS